MFFNNFKWFENINNLDKILNNLNILNTLDRNIYVFNFGQMTYSAIQHKKPL